MMGCLGNRFFELPVRVPVRGCFSFCSTSWNSHESHLPFPWVRISAVRCGGSLTRETLLSHASVMNEDMPVFHSERRGDHEPLRFRSCSATTLQSQPTLSVAETKQEPNQRTLDRPQIGKYLRSGCRPPSRPVSGTFLRFISVVMAAAAVVAEDVPEFDRWAPRLLAAHLCPRKPCVCRAGDSLS